MTRFKPLSNKMLFDSSFKGVPKVSLDNERLVIGQFELSL